MEGKKNHSRNGFQFSQETFINVKEQSVYEKHLVSVFWEVPCLWSTCKNIKKEIKFL